MKKEIVAFTLSLALALSAALAQEPRIRNARIEYRSAATGLEQQVRAIAANQPAAAWIGYAVPLVSGEHNICCNSSDNCCGTCLLEGKESNSFNMNSNRQVNLEAPRQLLVLLRIEAGRFTKLRLFSQQCDLDAGGLPFYWIADVRSIESINFLKTFATAESQETRDGKSRLESAVTAIALHGDAAADRVLEEFVAPGQPEKLRERAVFWLGAARGRRGFEVLQKLVRSDASEQIRDKSVFALYISKEADAVGEIINTARHDASSKVRGQALFWLGQKAGKKAQDAITGAIRDDPETDVKKRAVFALSQLPKDEGVPLLIQVARTNGNPEVRKQAMFWLGQSKDPRALAFFEEILSK